MFLKKTWIQALSVSLFASATAQSADPAATAPKPQKTTACPLNNCPRYIRPLQEPYGKGHFGASREGGRTHQGVDVIGTFGEPVYAINDAKVVLAAYLPDAKQGNTVVLCHTQGDASRFDHETGDFSIYYHLDTLNVYQGEIVKAGNKIGTMGYSGNAKGFEDAGYPPHLHFEFVKAGIRCQRVQDGLNAGRGAIRTFEDWTNLWNSLAIDAQANRWYDPAQSFSEYIRSGKTPAAPSGLSAE